MSSEKTGYPNIFLIFFPIPFPKRPARPALSPTLNIRRMSSNTSSPLLETHPVQVWQTISAALFAIIVALLLWINRLL